jgi:hypothetical protein
MAVLGAPLPCPEKTTAVRGLLGCATCTRPFRPVTDRLFFDAALRCLQGVNLHHLFRFTLHVGGEIAGTPAPLTLGVGEGVAVDAAGQCEGLAAALAGLDNLVTRAAIEAATVFTHKGALFTLLDRLTKHALSLLSHAGHSALGKMFGQKKPGQRDSLTPV